MKGARPEETAFAKVLTALQPYLGELVFVGGWAHRLFALHELARSPDFQPLMTEDADIAAPTRLKKGSESIAALLKGAGFHETFTGDDEPPVSEYSLGEEEGGFYVEFLTPLIGSGYRRDGRTDATATVAGVTVQKLRHVDLLITEPWRVRLSDANGFPLGADGLEFQIANATSYLAQKILVLPSRKADKQPKDVLYIHDTLLMFTEALDELRAIWTRIEAGIHKNTIRDLHRRRTELFDEVTDRTRSAAVIASQTGRGDSPSAERLTATCRLGLATIFG